MHSLQGQLDGVQFLTADLKSPSDTDFQSYFVWYLAPYCILELTGLHRLIFYCMSCPSKNWIYLVQPRIGCLDKYWMPCTFPLLELASFYDGLKELYFSSSFLNQEVLFHVVIPEIAKVYK